MVHLDQIAERWGGQIGELELLLRHAVQSAVPSDAPWAIQLSGGLDSAIVFAIADAEKLDPANLYCCTWENQDNLTGAKQVARDRYIHPVTFTKDEMLEALPDVAKLTKGKGTWSQVCQYFLARDMRRDGIKVVLNGEGADELFGGYARYRILHWIDRAYKDPRLVDYGSILRYTFGNPADVVVQMLERTNPRDWGYEVRRAKWKRGIVGAAMDVEERTGLAELIRMEGAVAAHFGIESRWPFLDPAVVQCAHHLPPELLVNDIYCKVALRCVAMRLGVSDNIVEEITKKGLFIPQHWRPAGHPKWGRKWFTKLMREAYKKC